MKSRTVLLALGRDVPISGGSASRARASLVTFNATTCLPFDVRTATRGSGSVTDLRGNAIGVEVNDPDVFEDALGGYTMLVHSRAMGGTLVLATSRRHACDPATSC